MKTTALITLLLPLSLQAQWNPDVTVNTRICDVEATQYLTTLCIDGEGGTFHAWSDNRVMGEPALFIQHLNAAGERLWTNDGVIVQTGGFAPALLADGAGGVWLAYHGTFSFDIQVQHFDADGERLLGPNGVQALFVTGIVGWPLLAHDGAGGVMLVVSVGSSLERAVAVQRVTAEGVPLWGSTGSGFTMGNNNCDDRMRIVQGDSASVVMLWGDLEHRLQRIDTLGNWRWGVTGVVVGPADGCYVRRRLCSDGNGGAYTLTMYTNGDEEAYLQQVRNDGSLRWSAPGSVIHRPNAYIGNIDISADGQGGVFILGMFNSSDQRVQVSHMDADGTVTGEHVLYSGGIQGSDQCQLGPVVSGLCPVLWYHMPPGNTVGKFQRIAVDGTTQWGGSITVYDGGGAGHMLNSELVSHADGSTTFGWEDHRYISPTNKVTAHHVASDFEVGITRQEPQMFSMHPVPTHGPLTIATDGNGSWPWMIRTMDGRVVMQGTMISGRSTLDLSRLAVGSYLLTLNKGQDQYTQRIVVAY